MSSGSSKWAWYSELMSVRHGYQVYVNNQGKEVHVTKITQERKNPYHESIRDVSCVGEIVNYVYHKDGSITKAHGFV